MTNILILDDEHLSRTRLGSALAERRHHNLLAAGNPDTWVQQAKDLAGAIDLLILDTSTKGISAPKLLRQLRSACPQTRILVLTHLPQHTNTRFFPLRKPFTDEEFVATVDRILNLNDAALSKVAADQYQELRSTAFHAPARHRVASMS